jgi:hypothetical protein
MGTITRFMTSGTDGQEYSSVLVFAMFIGLNAGAKARFHIGANAALKRRSSTASPA